MKTEIDVASQMLAIEYYYEAAKNHEINPLEAFVTLKKLEDTCKKLRDDLMAEALAELNKYDQKEAVVIAGATVSIYPSRNVFKFDKIEEWKNLQDQMKEVEAQAKMSFQAYERGNNLVSEDGEVLPLPEVSGTKESITVKFKNYG